MSYIWFFILVLTSISMGDTYQLEPIVSSGIEEPVHVLSGDAGQLYIVEQKGRIQLWDGNRLSKFLDIQSQVTSGGEMGLLSIALHPKFKSNGRYFLNYTAKRPKLQTFVVERLLNNQEERIILQIPQPYSNHNGGQIAFGPDGYLYIGMGDGGSGGDPHGHGQNKNSLLGKMLRIDVDGITPYAIPPGNPWEEQGGAKEIYAYGLRNPWRFSFDPVTGMLWAADVGQSAREEIDVIELGKNYGWNTMEGMICYEPQVNCNKTGLTLPLFDYPPTQGNSITGGHVYRGNELPELQGYYIYGDYVTGRIWALKYDFDKKKLIENKLLMESELAISSFGLYSNNEILIVSHEGQILKLDKKKE